MGWVMAERGTPEFYRKEATRLALLAIEIADPMARIQMLEMASTFKHLAERADNVIPFPRQDRESA